jgi:hypothetical protein
MSSKREREQDLVKLTTEDFCGALAAVQTEAEAEASAYCDMSPEEKRKCLDAIQQRIRTMEKIQKDLLHADRPVSPDQHVVQAVWKGQPDLSLTEDDLYRAFKPSCSRLPGHEWGTSPRLPKIISVSMQDNYVIDPASKQLQPQRMCFIKLQTAVDAQMVLDFGKLNVMGTNQHGGTGVAVEFVSPAETSAKRDTLRSVGKLVARVKEIDDKLKAMRAFYSQGFPKPPQDLVPAAFYAELLTKAKQIRQEGGTLDPSTAGILLTRQPADVSAIQNRMTALFNEKCDLVIRIREFQLSGLGFTF